MKKIKSINDLPDAVDRLEANLKPYVQRVLAAMQIKAQVLISTDSEELRNEGVAVVINAQEDLRTVDMGARQQSMFTITIYGQIDKVPEKSHKAIVARLRAAIWDIRPDQRYTHAAQGVLDAVNFVPRRKDVRPCSRIHLWDIRDPSSSLSGRDSTAATTLAGTAFFSPWDWNGATRYPVEQG